MTIDLKTLVNIILLIWGALFCFVISASLFLSENYPKDQRKWMLCMLLTTALLLISDVFAWFYRGDSSEKTFYIIRISNFMVFILTDLILLFFQHYIGFRLSEKGIKNEKRMMVAKLLAIIAILMVVISQFTEFYYYIDENNYYHRNSGYIVSVILPYASMLLDMSVLIENRKQFRKFTLFAMISYIILPLVAALIQFFMYGMSLTNFAIVISMVLLFVTSAKEQDNFLKGVIRSNKQTTEKLQIASTLNQCVKELSENVDESQALHNLLKIINDYFKADRTYIFEIEPKREILINTYEYVEGQVTAQQDNLQEVPLDVIAEWMKAFEKGEPYLISNLEQEKGTNSYDMLVEQEIYCLLAVPLTKNNEVIGFLGVDNPRAHSDDATLLAAIQFFITNTLDQKKEKEYLQYLSYRDKLTGLYNRNRYIELIDGLKGKQIYQTGVAWVDLNGLKEENDKKGHAAGDLFIENASKLINDIFFDKCYRTGGDEFAVVSIGVEEKQFIHQINQLKANMQQQSVSASIGYVWEEVVEDLEETMKIADGYMYEEKQKYYQSLKSK